MYRTGLRKSQGDYHGVGGKGTLVIRITRDRIPHIQVLAANTGEYVANSHVWADGLGNLKDNIIPRCQLEYLDYPMKNLKQCLLGKELLSEQVEFYTFIDTLTFPQSGSARGTELETKRKHELKADAIRKMKEFYKNAICVMVLENSLTACCYQDINKIEAFFQVSTSKWTRRLWTLQEVLLPPKLWVQFKDRAVDLKELYCAAVEEWRSSQDQRLLAYDLLSEIYVWRFFYTPNYQIEQENPPLHTIFQQHIHPLHTVSENVWRRQCSKPADEAICMAILLNLDMEELGDDKSAELQMQYMWNSMDKSPVRIPPHIITLRGPRLIVDGFRWALSSFLQSRGSVEWFVGSYSDLLSAKVFTSNSQESIYNPLPHIGNTRDV